MPSRLFRHVSTWFDRWTSGSEGRGLPPKSLWLVFALPGLYQLALMLRAFAGRLPYRFQLEWMEDGMLTQALRIAQGHPPYQPPSVDFVAHLYSPAYPMLLAALEPVAGLSYGVGRLVSVLSVVTLLGLLVATACYESEEAEPYIPLVAASVGATVVALGYPFTSGWYDLVRADSLMCALVAIGLYGLRTSPVGRGPVGGEGALQFVYPRTAAWGVVLASAFFAKQTAVIFVAAGAAALLFIEWRALGSYLVAAATVGFGGLGVLHAWTGGWSWTYMYGYHQHHDSSSERFWNALRTSFDLAPPIWLLTGTVLAAALLWLACSERRVRALRGLVYWSWMAGVAALVAAVGMSTQWAAKNAFMPVFVCGAFAATVALVALADATRRLDIRLHHAVLATALTVCAAFSLSRGWEPTEYLPSAEDQAANHRLLETIRKVDGEVFAPYFPWYARLADKDVHAHLMGLKDVDVDPGCAGKRGLSALVCPPLSDRATRVGGLHAALRDREFGAVFLHPRHDLRDQMPDYRRETYYHTGDLPLPPTGWTMNRLVKFTPEIPPPAPDDGRLLFDGFETPDLPTWRISGDAWGDGPTTSARPKQSPVGGYFGHRFMNSFHGGDKSTGVAISPSFELRRPLLHLRVGGGKGGEKLQVELRDPSGRVLRTATGRDSEMLRAHTWEVDEHVGEKLRIALVDRRSDHWGHLLVDSIRTAER